MLANHSHSEVRAVLAAVLLRERVAVMPGGVGAAAGLAQQRLPFEIGQAAAFPVGAGVLATMIEETDVVVREFERSYLTLDEVVEFGEVRDQVGGDLEVHARTLGGVRLRV